MKSKERVQKFAEVYTPAHIVKDMCDLIPDTEKKRTAAGRK